MLAAYMIRLSRADLEDPEQISALARAGALDEGLWSSGSATS